MRAVLPVVPNWQVRMRPKADLLRQEQHTDKLAIGNMHMRELETCENMHEWVVISNDPIVIDN